MPRLIPEFKMTFPVPNDPDNAEVTIMHLLDGEIAEISSQCSETKLTCFEPDKVIRTTTIDNAKEALQIVNKAVPAWKNFKDAKGEDLECNFANKRLFVHQGWFLKFIEEKRKIVKAEFEKQYGEVLKNLLALPPGSPAPAGKAATNVS